MCTSKDQPPCVASSLDDKVDFNAGLKQQAATAIVVRAEKNGLKYFA
jgi:hypothetical protein